MRNFTSLIAFVVAVISITAAAAPASEFNAKVDAGQFPLPFVDFEANTTVI